MHGLNFSFIPKIENDLPGPDPTDGLGGMRNLLPLPASKAFGRLGGSNESLRGLMGKLAGRINREQDWQDRLPGAARPEENPKIPSGYTYLLQLVAHDVVNTAISLAATRGRYFHNARTQALMLDTVFGAGPDVTPHAYEYTQLVKERHGLVPRTRLRAGRSRGDHCTAGQPFDDIGRATPVDARDDGLTVDQAPCKSLRTEALLADPRNDDHALISQMTLLWHRLHNHLIGVIETSLSTLFPVEKAYQSFLLSRFIMTIVYRKIVLYDVLGKLLHPIAFKYYVLDQQPLIAKTAGGVPMEFAHGAFRCGHAMVRDRYRVNGEPDLETHEALRQSARRSPTFLPVTRQWVVDWARFFTFNGSSKPLNHSRRLGPRFSEVARNSDLFPALVFDGATDETGLHSRDLVTSVFAHLWSVPPLIEALRGRSAQLRNFLPSYDEYQGPLEAWLKARTNAQPFITQLEPGEVATLVNDPPLPFFVLFEAALGDRTGAPPFNPGPPNPFEDGGQSPLRHHPFEGGGQTLGPLGSIIVAETVLGAMEDHPLGNDLKARDPHEGLAAATREIASMGHLDESVSKQLPEIRTMPDLLDFMHSRGLLPEGV